MKIKPWPWLDLFCEVSYGTTHTHTSAKPCSLLFQAHGGESRQISANSWRCPASMSSHVRTPPLAESTFQLGVYVRSHSCAHQSCCCESIETMWEHSKVRGNSAAWQQASHELCVSLEARETKKLFRRIDVPDDWIQHRRCTRPSKNYTLKQSKDRK